MIAVALPSLNAATARSTFDRAIGELSYPLYLVHVPIISLLGAFQVFRSSYNLYILTVFTLAIATASALTIAIDKPLDRIGQRLAKQHGARVDRDSGVAPSCAEPAQSSPEAALASNMQV
jgi:peptidoglycan/LPS O-acetylase OafA/YrhL